MDNSIEDQVSKLAEKCCLLQSALEKCLGITLDSDLPPGTIVPLREKSFPIHLTEDIQDIYDFDIALETLNQIGNERGVGFKKGTQKQNKGEAPYQKSIICKFQDRNKDKKFADHNERSKKSSKECIKDVNCPVFYKFGVKDNCINLQVFHEDHNHSPNLNVVKKLTIQMINEISYFNKGSKVTDIQQILEKKFACGIDYMSIYHEFRRLFPRFDEKDCENFIKYLDANNAKYRCLIDENNRSLCRLLFCTKLMVQNYQLYGDILIVDSTYNTNYYSVPLVVISGVDGCYRNIIFAIAFLNNESEETYSWIFSAFKSIMKKDPLLIITDMDPSLTGAIAKEYPNVQKRLCSWHVCRNLQRNFRFLTKDVENLKNLIAGLPLEYSRKKFDENVEKIKAYLISQKYDKSLKYLENLLQKKDQWARSYHPEGFDADISTTSRVESWNALIKHYLNSKSKISDIIDFIEGVERKCSLFESSAVQHDSNSLIEYDSLLRDLKSVLPSKVYDQCLMQYALGRRDYTKKVLLEEKTQTVYNVAYEDKSHQGDAIKNHIDAARVNPIYTVVSGEKMTCNCGYFESTGLVCRHIFFICGCESMRDIRRLNISSRWLALLSSNEIHFSKPCVGYELKEEEQEKKKEALKLLEDENVNQAAQKVEELLRNFVTNESPAEKDQNEKIKEGKSLVQDLITVVLQKGEHIRVENFEKTTSKGAPRKSFLFFSL